MNDNNGVEAPNFNPGCKHKLQTNCKISLKSDWLIKMMSREHISLGKSKKTWHNCLRAEDFIGHLLKNNNLGFLCVYNELSSCFLWVIVTSHCACARLFVCSCEVLSMCVLRVCRGRWLVFVLLAENRKEFRWISDFRCFWFSDEFG